MFATRITFDIETYRTTNAEAVQRIRLEAIDKEPAGNTLKALKETWNTTEAREARADEALAKTSLDPLLAEILCVSLYIDYPDGSFADSTFDLMRGKHSLEIVRRALESIANEDTLWIGHNICGFDLPILLNSWRRSGMIPPTHFPRYIRGHWQGTLYDTMQNIPNNRGGFVSLDAACQAFGLGSAKHIIWNGAHMEGSRVAEAYETGFYDLILEYCAIDVSFERALYLCLTSGGRYATPEAARADLRAAIAEIEANPDLDDTSKAITIGNLVRRHLA
jgi:hypothetical protein